MDDRDDHCRDRTAEDGAREERHDSRGHGREQLAGQFHDRRQVLEPDAAGARTGPHQRGGGRDPAGMAHLRVSIGPSAEPVMNCRR